GQGLAPTWTALPQHPASEPTDNGSRPISARIATAAPGGFPRRNALPSGGEVAPAHSLLFCSLVLASVCRLVPMEPMAIQAVSMILECFASSNRDGRTQTSVTRPSFRPTHGDDGKRRKFHSARWFRLTSS